MGRIPEEDVQRVRDATDLVSLVAETVVLKQKGRLFWGNCPFHGEKTPSFKVDPATQLWHCFGCSRGGDAFGYIMEAEHLEFPDAVRRLAERGRIEIREEGGQGLPAGRKERLIAVYLIAFAIPCSAQLALSIAILGRIGLAAFAITVAFLAAVESRGREGTAATGRITSLEKRLAFS